MSAQTLAIRGFREPCQRRVRQQYLQHQSAAKRRLRPVYTSASSKARINLPWRNDKAAVKVASQALDQPDERQWRRRDDTVCLAEQPADLRSRLQQFISSPYDAEIFAILFPALLAILLDPVMILIDTGKLCTALNTCSSRYLAAVNRQLVHLQLLLAG